MRSFEEIVLFCDNHLLVVCKPAGVPCQPDRSGDADLLTLGKVYLKERFDKPGRVFLGLVHRLDRPVSGVMVYARTSKSASRLSRQFRRREVEKRYVAVVEGTTGQAGRESGYVQKSGRGVVRASEDDRSAAYCELSWAKIADTKGDSILDVRLVTGRKHQIRYQLSALGHPIVGDRRYGATRPFDGRNLALHCYTVAVDHPTLRTRMSWQEPPPATWGEAGTLVCDWLGSGHPPT